MNLIWSVRGWGARTEEWISWGSIHDVKGWPKSGSSAMVADWDGRSTTIIDQWTFFWVAWLSISLRVRKILSALELLRLLIGFLVSIFFCARIEKTINPIQLKEHKNRQCSAVHLSDQHYMHNSMKKFPIRVRRVGQSEMKWKKSRCKWNVRLPSSIPTLW